MTYQAEPDNSQLVAALHQAYARGQAPGPEFGAALLTASLFVPRTAAADGFQLFTGDAGEPVCYVFPSLDEAGAFYAARPDLGEPPSAALVPARDLCGLAVEHQVGVVIVTTVTSYRLSQGEIQAVLEGVVHDGDRAVQIVEPTTCWVGSPEDLLPKRSREGCLAELRAALAPLRPHVHEIVWFSVQLGDGPAHLGLAVRPDHPDLRRWVGTTVEPIWGRYLPDNPAISVLSPGEPGMGEAIAAKGLPL